MVHSRGFEPLTFASGGQRSIHLSYECALIKITYTQIIGKNQ